MITRYNFHVFNEVSPTYPRGSTSILLISMNCRFLWVSVQVRIFRWKFISTPTIVSSSVFRIIINNGISRYLVDQNIRTNFRICTDRITNIPPIPDRFTKFGPKGIFSTTSKNGALYRIVINGLHILFNSRRRAPKRLLLNAANSMIYAFYQCRIRPIISTSCFLRQVKNGYYLRSLAYLKVCDRRRTKVIFRSNFRSGNFLSSIRTGRR